MNDIQTYANRYSKFRLQSAPFFDLTIDEKEAVSQIKNKEACKLRLLLAQDAESESSDAGSSEEFLAEVPCDPAMTKCFQCLEIID